MMETNLRNCKYIFNLKLLNKKSFTIICKKYLKCKKNLT